LNDSSWRCAVAAGSERFRIDARLMALTEKMKVRHVVGQGDEKAVKVAAN
jgi:hypothetical protein